MTVVTATPASAGGSAEPAAAGPQKKRRSFFGAKLPSLPFMGLASASKPTVVPRDKVLAALLPPKSVEPPQKIERPRREVRDRAPAAAAAAAAAESTESFEQDLARPALESRAEDGTESDAAATSLRQSASALARDKDSGQRDNRAPASTAGRDKSASGDPAPGPAANNKDTGHSSAAATRAARPPVSSYVNNTPDAAVQAAKPRWWRKDDAAEPVIADRIADLSNSSNAQDRNLDRSVRPARPDKGKGKAVELSQPRKSSRSQQDKEDSPPPNRNARRLSASRRDHQHHATDRNLNRPSSDEVVDVVPARPRAKQPPPFKMIRKNMFPYRDVQRTSNIVMCECGPSGTCGEKCEDRVMNYVCGPQCSCKATCDNIALHKRKMPLTRVVYTGSRGFGLMAMEDISEGDFVIDYRGEVITLTAFRKRCRAQYAAKTEFYALAYDSVEVIDSGNWGNEARFINHGCSPNLEVRKYELRSLGLEEFEIGMWATRDISAGEELFFNYNYDSFNANVTAETRTKCLCGAANCIGFLGRARDVQNTTTAARSRSRTKSPARRRAHSPAKTAKKAHKVPGTVPGPTAATKPDQRISTAAPPAVTTTSGSNANVRKLTLTVNSAVAPAASQPPISLAPMTASSQPQVSFAPLTAASRPQNSLPPVIAASQPQASLAPTVGPAHVDVTTENISGSMEASAEAELSETQVKKRTRNYLNNPLLPRVKRPKRDLDGLTSLFPRHPNQMLGGPLPFQEGAVNMPIPRPKSPEAPDNGQRISGWADWLVRKAAEKPRTLEGWNKFAIERRRGRKWKESMMMMFGVAPYEGGPRMPWYPDPATRHKGGATNAVAGCPDTSGLWRRFEPAAVNANEPPQQQAGRESMPPSAVSRSESSWMPDSAEPEEHQVVDPVPPAFAADQEMEDDVRPATPRRFSDEGEDEIDELDPSDLEDEEPVDRKPDITSPTPMPVMMKTKRQPASSTSPVRPMTSTTSLDRSVAPPASADSTPAPRPPTGPVWPIFARASVPAPTATVPQVIPRPTEAKPSADLTDPAPPAPNAVAAPAAPAQPRQQTEKKQAIAKRNGAPMGWAYVPVVAESGVPQPEELGPRSARKGRASFSKDDDRRRSLPSRPH